MNTYTSTQVTNPDYTPNQADKSVDSNLMLGTGFVIAVILYAIIMNLVRD